MIRAIRRFVRRPVTTLLIVTAALAFAAPAAALVLRAGNIIIHADGGFAPKALPKYHNAPITIHGGGSLSTVSGGPPPIIETIAIEFDRHGAVDTTGLEVCSAGKLKATTVPQARRQCPNAIVGEGHGHAVVYFPEQHPIPADSPITLFNGPPDHGDPTVIAHAFTTIPAPTTFIVPITIERIHRGVYGYRTNARIPRIAGGYGVPISGFLHIGRKWTSKGVKHSYISARCETGRLQARGQFGFKDGTSLRGTFVRPCQVRR